MQGIWSAVPPRVRALVLSQMLNGFAFGFFLIFVTGFFPENGISSIVIGTVLTLEGIVVAVAGIPMAILSDRRGRKWFVIAGGALFPPAIIAFALSRSVEVLYLAATLGGLAEAMLLASWNAIVADQTNLSNRDAAFSLSFVTGTAAFSMGGALPLAFPSIEAIAQIDSASLHSTVLLLLGLVNFATPLIFWRLLRGYKEAAQGGLKFGGIGRTLKFSFFNSIIGLGAGLIIPLLATWLYLKFGVQDTYSGPFLALSGLTIAFAAVASPRVSRRIGLFPAILATAGSSTIFMFSLAFVPNVYVAGGIYLIRAGLMNMNAPLMDSYLMGITQPNRRGLASMLNAVIWRIPNSASTIIGGFLLAGRLGTPIPGLSNYDVPWVAAAGLYVVGIILLYVGFRTVKPVA